VHADSGGIGYSAPLSNSAVNHLRLIDIAVELLLTAASAAALR